VCCLHIKWLSICPTFHVLSLTPTSTHTHTHTHSHISHIHTLTFTHTHSHTQKILYHEWIQAEGRGGVLFLSQTCSLYTGGKGRLTEWGWGWTHLPGLAWRCC